MSKFSPAGFGIGDMKFRHFDIINKSDPLSKCLLPLFLNSPDSWRNTAFAFTCQSSLDGKSRHFDIVSSREMHLTQVLFDRNTFIFMLDCLMLACSNFLPHSCAPVATPLGSFKDQEYSLAFPQSVYFSLIKTQCLLVSKAEGLQIQGI